VLVLVLVLLLLVLVLLLLQAPLLPSSLLWGVQDAFWC
jgi:hypothetical protein